MDSSWNIASLPNGIACHSREFAGDGIEIARAIAYAYIAEYSLEVLGPPAVVGRGDHVYVEVYARATGSEVALAEPEPVAVTAIEAEPPSVPN